jgi:hypothetical protein
MPEKKKRRDSYQLKLLFTCPGTPVVKKTFTKKTIREKLSNQKQR